MTTPESKLRFMKDSVDDQVADIQVSIDQIDAQIEELTEQATAIDEAMMDPAADDLESYLYGKALEIQYPIYTFEGIWADGTAYVVNDAVVVLGADATSGIYICIQNHTATSISEPGVGASWASYWSLAPPLTTVRVNLGAAYNATSINEWEIQQLVLAIWTTVYAYLGVGWDGDTQIIEYQDDWDFGCDYLNHPLGVPATGPDCVMRVAPGARSSYGLYPQISSLNIAKTIVTNNQTKIDDSKDVFDRYLEE